MKRNIFLGAYAILPVAEETYTETVCPHIRCNADKIERGVCHKCGTKSLDVEFTNETNIGYDSVIKLCADLGYTHDEFVYAELPEYAILYENKEGNTRHYFNDADGIDEVINCYTSVDMVKNFTDKYSKILNKLGSNIGVDGVKVQYGLLVYFS